MNKHTPGPWNTATALSGKLFVTIDHNIGMARKQVCEVLPDITTGDYKANARLIAAAPDMLKALERAEQTIRNLGHGFLSDDGQTIAFNESENLRAAIAKAKGES